MNTKAWASGLMGLLLTTAVGAQAPAEDMHKPVNDVLSRIRQRGDDQKLADREMALTLIKQAQAARDGGRLGEAVKLAEKANVLFPESVAVRQTLHDLRIEQVNARDLALSQSVAKNRMEEAADFAESLFRDKKFSRARDLAAAIKEAGSHFPPGVDVTTPMKTAEKILSDAANVEAIPEPKPEPKEVLPPPEPAPPKAPPSPTTLRVALAKRLDTEWRDVPMAAILQDLANETGVAFTLDPELYRTHVFELRRVSMHAHDVPAERVLRTLTDFTTTGYLLIDGEVRILPKWKAVQTSVVKSRDMTDTGQRSALFPLSMPNRPAAPPLRPPLEKLPLPVPADQTDYLANGKAFVEHINGLLKPAPAKNEEP